MSVINGSCGVVCADMVAGQALFLTEVAGLLDAAKHPNCTALLQKLKARPAFNKVFNAPKKGSTTE